MCECRMTKGHRLHSTVETESRAKLCTDNCEDWPLNSETSQAHELSIQSISPKRAFGTVAAVRLVLGSTEQCPTTDRLERPRDHELEIHEANVVRMHAVED